MAKKSHKRQVRRERGHPGCMGGLISMFDFRQGRSAQKLLVDRKHGSARQSGAAGSSRSKLKNDFDEKNQGSNDNDKRKASKADIAKTSVKKLMEEDMSAEQQLKKQILSLANEQIHSDSELGGHFAKNQKQSKRTRKLSCDIDTKGLEASPSLDSRDPECQNLFEEFSHLDLAALMEEFCNQIHLRQEVHLKRENMGESCDVVETTNHVKHSHLDELDLQLVRKHSVLQEKLSEAAEAFLNQKFIDRHQSKLFMDALDILNSNKELLVRLLQDSNSVLVKHVQDPRNLQSEKIEHSKLPPAEEIGVCRQGEEVESEKHMQKHISRNIFRRSKSQNKNPSKGNDSQASNRIVVLKPNAMSSRSSLTPTTSSPSSSPQSLHSLRSQGSSGKLSSQFSLSEIKRKLKHAMRENKKEQNSVVMDGILHRIPTKHHDSGNGRKSMEEETAKKESPTKALLHEELEKFSVSCENRDKAHSHSDTDREVASTSAPSSRDLTIKRDGYPNHRVTNIYIEAKKHLADMLSHGDADGDFSHLHVPRTLGRILSLPEYDFSPVFSPGKEKQYGFVTAQMRFSPSGKFRIVNENMWWPKPDDSANYQNPPRSSTDIENPEVRLQELDCSADATEELPDSETRNSTCSSGNSSPKGNVEDIGVSLPMADIFVNEPSESDKSTDIVSTTTTKIWEEEHSSKCLTLVSPENGQPPSISCGSLSVDSLLIHKGESMESITDTPERPSPVSVLEPVFLEDVSSPTRIISQSAEVPVQPLQIHFEEDDCCSLVVTHTDTENYPRTCLDHKNFIFEYVTTILQASDLNLDDLVEKFYSSEQLLDSSMFDEVELFTSELCGDRKLLFDSTNEVLFEVCERYFGCSPWVGFVNPAIRPAPVGKGIIDEVWEGINCHLVPHLAPRTLDQIVGKDMEKARMWMDFRFDTEIIGIDMAEVILEELVTDTILGLCS